MKDRFTEASLDLADHGAYACHGCETTYGHPTFMHLDTTPNPPATRDTEWRDATCLLNCDPVPFGD